MRYRDIAAQHSVSEQPDSKNYLLQLERDTRAGMLILHILDKNTGKRTEVRGKMGYETNGYDPNDKLHQLLDKVGKSASVSDLMNGDVVSINPRHPDGASAKAAADKAYDEDRHPNEKPIGPETKPTMPSGTIRVKVSDVYDWYKLGQHISDLEGLGKHDFGKGPPEAVISFGSEEQEHKYIELLKQLGLEIIDVDPKAADVPGVKTDPTYNTESLDQPYPYRWGVQSEDEWAARARTDSGAILDIRFEYGSWDAIWDIEFTLNGRYKATAAGDQFRIFATVVKAIKEWWKSTSAEGIPVNTIRFSADKLNNQTRKVIQQICTTICKQYRVYYTKQR